MKQAKDFAKTALAATAATLALPFVLVIGLAVVVYEAWGSVYLDFEEWLDK